MLYPFILLYYQQNSLIKLISIVLPFFKILFGSVASYDSGLLFVRSTENTLYTDYYLFYNNLFPDFLCPNICWRNVFTIHMRMFSSLFSLFVNKTLKGIISLYSRKVKLVEIK